MQLLWEQINSPANQISQMIFFIDLSLFIRQNKHFPSVVYYIFATHFFSSYFLLLPTQHMHKHWSSYRKRFIFILQMIDHIKNRKSIYEHFATVTPKHKCTHTYTYTPKTRKIDDKIMKKQVSCPQWLVVAILISDWSTGGHI